MTLAIVALLMTTFVVPTGAWGATQPSPEWTAAGTRWASSTSLAPDEIDRFHEIWTARFLDDAGLQAYLDRPGLYDDGYNDLSEEDKAALIVSLIQYWQETLPGFGNDFWTGDPEQDQSQFEQLAMMMYATIFAKDAFLAAMREKAGPAAMGPPAPEDLDVDAGIAEFPGMSQADITAYFDELHLSEAVVAPAPALPDLGVPPHLVPDQKTIVTAPTAPAFESMEAPGVTEIEIPGTTTLLDLDGILALIPDVEDIALPPPSPNQLLNTVAGGTYLACGSLGSGPVRCAPTPMLLGVPVALDLDGNLLTGVAGAEVTVLLTPTVNPDFAVGGFAAMLRVDRTQPSTLPTSTSLPAQAYVVYTVPGAATQIMAGFDARTNTLGNTQELRVTLENVALALAGDVRLSGKLTRAGPGTTLTLLSGFAKIDPSVYPPAPRDPTTVGIRFDPVPSTLDVGLRFYETSQQRFIVGSVDASLSPTVTASIGITRGASQRTIVGIVESMPTQIDFTIVSEAVGAVSLDYVANGPFPRFEVHDVLVPDVSVPSKYSTLDAVVLGVPAVIGFDIVRPFTVTYAASARVTSATVAITERDALGIVRSMAATATGIPTQWSIAGSTSPIQFDYTADGTLDAIDATMMVRNGAGPTYTTYTASVAAIPRFLRITAGSSDFTVDARTSSTAASGSGTIGAITARYTTDGAFIGGSGNYANLYQTATVTRAALGYTGLKYVRMNLVNDNLLVDVMNSAPRYFTAYADTPEAYVSLTIDSIPAHVMVTGSGTTFTYNAFGSMVNVISAYFTDKEGLTAIMSVRGIPGLATVNVNLPASTITYGASSPITAIDVDVWIAQWYGRLRISGVPTAWTASFGNGVYAFDAFPQSIGSVDAAVTNHGWWSAFGGNHLNLDYVHGGAVDASFRMTAVQRALYSRVGTEQSLDLRMGGGTTFIAMAEALLSTGERAFAYTSFTPLPSSIQVTVGEKFVANTNQNFDVYAYAEFGTPAALATAPAPPYVHGFGVRDGASGAAKAVKGQLWLTGLPTSVTLDGRNGAFGFTNWRPTVSSLIVDAELNDVVTTPVDLFVQQSGIPNPQSLSFAMSSADIGGGAKRVKVDVTQTAAMGALFADLVSGVQHGRLTVSNIPDDIHATYTVQNGQSTLVWDATAPISNIFAAFRVTTLSSSFQGYLSLTDLPSDFTLIAGRAAGGQGPTIAYSASASTLDVVAFVDASLFGGDLKARLSFGLTNLGAATNVFVSGNSLRFTSSPATGNIFANVWATYNYYREDSGTWDEGGFVEFPWAYHVGVTPTVNNLAVTLTNFSDFTLAWGVTTKLSGSYGTFSFGWSSFTVDLHAYGKIQIVVDWPWPFGSSTINIVNIHYHPGTINISVLFHTYTNHQAYWFGTSGWAICDWWIWMDIRPHPHGATWNGVSTSAATAEGGAWYVTPNPWGALPGWGIDLAARYTSPDGGAIGGPHFDYDCW